MLNESTQSDQNERETHALVLVRRRLRVLARRVRLVLVSRAVITSLAWFVLAAFAMAAADYMLHLPVPIRVIGLLGMLLLLARSIRNTIIPAWRTRPDETIIALAIESQIPSLRGVLASAVELSASAQASHAEPDEIEHALADAVGRIASRRLGSFNPAGVIRLRHLGAAVGAFMLLIAPLLILAAISPSTTGIAASRVLVPWMGTRWPTRYAINDLSPNRPRPLDAPVTIRAGIGDASTRLDDQARTVINWRILDARGRPVIEWSRSMLMPQRRRDQESGAPIYEQLLDAQSVMTRRDEQRFVLEYQIRTPDDRTATQRIELVRPPLLVEATARFTLPEYAQQIASGGTVLSDPIVSQREDLSISPVLAGSAVELRWSFSKPIVLPEQEPQWLGSLRENSEVLGFDQPSPEQLRLRIRPRDSMMIEPGIIGERGIPIRTPIIVSLGVLKDLDPSAALIDPSRDEVLSNHAVLELGGELSDDLGLARGALSFVVARPATDSAGGAPEPIGDPQPLVESTRIDARSYVLRHTLDLADLGLNAGDEVWLSVEAWDIRAHPDQPELGYSRSATRVLRIVEDSVLVDQIRGGLDPLRETLRRLDEQQTLIEQRTRQQLPSAEPDQRALTSRLEASARAVEEMREMISRNTLDDEQLGATLSDAEQILNEAIEQSEQASQRIGRGEHDRASQNQGRVRDRLGELLSMLDRGQDAWLALRGVEQLREELAALQEDTAAFSAKAAGKQLDQLTPEERSALEQILDRQLQSATDAQNAIDALDERAQILEETDPTQAQALRSAAQQGRASQLEQRLNEAADQIAQNQTGSASQTQQEVLDELESMLDELDHAIKNRDNALRRELASIIESIKSLIGSQQVEIDQLVARIGLGQLDARMIVLVGNTLSVRDEAMGAFPETRSIADHISSAASSQNGAINALRSAPPGLDEAERAERGALQQLNNALAEAKRLDEQAAQRQAAKLREELRDAYRQALEQQALLRGSTEPLMGERLSRRQRSSARALARVQDDISTSLRELHERTEALSEAPMFSLAHTQLELLMQRSSNGLSQSSIPVSVLGDQDRAIVILSSLVEVLGDDQQPDDSAFDDGQSGGGDGGGQGGGDDPAIPPIAQLRLLRTMQQLVADQTRTLDEQPTPDPQQVRSVSELQKQLFETGKALIENMNPSSPTPGTAPTGDE